MKFGNLSIRRKVALVTLLIPSCTILFAAFGWYILHQTTIRRLAESELNKLADLVSLGVNDAVMGFQPSPADAARALEVLRNKSEIDEAHIFTVPDLGRFASTPVAAEPPADLIARGLGFHADDRGLWLVREMTDDRGRVFGWVALHSTLATLQLERRRSLEWLGIVAFGMFGVAYWASRMFGRSLSRPLGALMASMEKIGESRDQSRRVPTLGRDEIGQLAMRINHMLHALEQQSTALKENEERTRALVATAPAAIVVIDVETGLFVEANDNACQLYGLGRGELCRRGPLDLSPVLQPGGQPSASLAPAMIARGMAGEKPRFEWLHLDSTGREIHCDIALVRLASLTRKLICGILVDITDRKRSEERLRKSQAGLEEAQALAGIGSWERCIGAARAEWSREMFRLHGRDPAAGAPDVDQLMALVHPDDREETNRQYREVLAGGSCDDLYYRTNPDSGRVRHMRLRFAQLRDEAGNMVMVRGTCMDVTAQREVDEQRRQLENQMRQAQKLEALGTLSGGIAHDFNNILTAILGNVELARMDPADSAAVQECLLGIDRVGRRARDLVQRILAFSRQQEQILAPVSLRPVVEEVFKLLRSTMPANVVLEMFADPSAPCVLGDASQIHQMVMNLATNAWHALDQRAGRIRFELKPVQVDSRLSQTSPDLQAGPYVRLDVRDDGMGMSPAVIERIFEPFFTTKAPGRGTGLGLSVVHGIMKSHGGAITVESVSGLGSTFHLYFPAVEGAEIAATPAIAAGLAHGCGQHVLFVDDEEALVSVGMRVLRKLGYEVTGFSQPEEAWQAFQAEPGKFQLVITDLSMPGLSGLELARNVLGIRPDLPIILSSGYLKDDEVGQAHEVGIREIVVKPTVFDQLAAVLKKLLG